MHPGPSRVLAALVGAVVLLAVIAGVVIANRSAPELDPASPEGVVQQYLEAVIDEDYSTALGLVSSSLGCEVSEIAEMRPYSGSLHVVLDKVRINGDQAVVTLDVTEGGGEDPFGSSGYTRSERVVLEQEDGGWRLASAPWLLYLCEQPKEPM